MISPRLLTCLAALTAAGSFALPAASIASVNDAPVSEDVSTWLRWEQPWNASTSDLSGLVLDAPAGRRGFVSAKGDRFFFEDGTEARFWGVAMCYHNCYPPKDIAEQWAERFAKLGFNLVRFHHMDAKWGALTPWFIDYDKGDSQSFVPEHLDRWHYFVAALKKRGIYVMQDNLVHRRFQPGDDVENAENLEAAGKPASLFNRRLIELQKDFARKLWTTVNPYTGLAPKDDPVFAVGNIINETEIITPEQTPKAEPWRTEYEQGYRAWMKAQGNDVPEGKVDFSKVWDDVDIKRYAMHVQTAYYEEMTAFFRQLGVRIPLSGSNWGARSGIGHYASLESVGFYDSHLYYNHPVVHQKPYTYTSELPLVRHSVAGESFARTFTKPHLVSEWADVAPSRYRSAMTLLMPAYARFQGWSGMVFFSWAGVNYDYPKALKWDFTSHSDPAIAGIMPHGALLYLRDASLARETVTALVDVNDDAQVMNKRIFRHPTAMIADEHRVGVAFREEDAVGKVIRYPFTDYTAPLPPKRVMESDTGEIFRDPHKVYALIRTPGTQAAAGLLGEQGRLELPDMSVEISTRFATVVVSALDGPRISASRDLLLTTIGRVQNTGSKFSKAEGEGVWEERGTAPLLAEPILGSVVLKTRAELVVEAVDASGKVTAVLKTERTPEGWLAIALTRETASLHYRLRASGAK